MFKITKENINDAKKLQMHIEKIKLKINFGTEIRYKYVEHYKEALEKLDYQGHSWKLSQYASDALTEDVKKIIELSGSAGTV